MKLKFIDQEFQTEAVNSIIDIFEGSEYKESVFTIDKSQDSKNDGLKIQGEGLSYDLGYSNKLTIDSFSILRNIRGVQDRNNLPKSKELNGLNFSVEMETGTGKTYVYIKTILELNKKYGMTKFIIVVPSIAIKEGVLKSFQITEQHFKTKYDNLSYNYFVYDSKKLNLVRSFSTNTNLEIMIINIDAFKKDFGDDNKGNIIHRPSDFLSGNRPIDLIAGTNPVIIIDEPQSVDNTPTSKKAINTLNPLFILRYSATHRQEYNLMYRLTPVDAYQRNLVKHIEVSSVMSDEISAKPYIKLVNVSNKKGEYSAKIEIHKNFRGSYSKKLVKVKRNDDLWEISNEVENYRDQNYRVQEIICTDGKESIIFAEGTKLHIGESIGSPSADAIKRGQIRETIDLHLQKELKHLKKGIKVLSLFFIDKVDNYRQFDSNGKAIKGKYAIWFEEEYENLINNKYKHLKARHKSHYSYMTDEIHKGYFSVDRKGHYKDTSGKTKIDDSTYELIMKDKELLLDLKTPLRFIFSHSALKEGWDNPNVFQICTLVETKDTRSKRQKIGRGLRICVDQSGSRVNDISYNMLSVIANESYKHFASQLQKELESEAGYKFGVVTELSFTDIEVTKPNGSEQNLTQDQSIEIYNYLKEEKYLDSKNKVTQKFRQAVIQDAFIIPNKYDIFKNKVQRRIISLSREIEIKDATKKVKVNINKKVFLSKAFTKAFEKIQDKTFYSVDINTEELISEIVEEASNMPKIESEKIRRKRSKLNITKSGVKNDLSVREENIGNIYDFEKPIYPDIIRRLQESTGLIRKDIIDILLKIDEKQRLNEFNLNPELFLRQINAIITNKKRIHIIKGIQYHKSDGKYIMKEIFDDSELYGYENRNILDISDEKNVYDHVIFDSLIEKQFAEDAEADESVLIYAKLPQRFHIDTPYGKYNPDWLVVIQSESEHKLYFVAETKGSINISDLRESEKSKIISGRKHFEAVDTDVKYEVITKLGELKR